MRRKKLYNNQYHINGIFTLATPIGLLLLTLYYFAARLGQTSLYDNYASICTSSAPGLFFSNRISSGAPNTYYPLSCWQTNVGEDRYGLNFTTEESRQDFAQADAHKIAIRNELTSDSYKEKIKQLEQKYSSNYNDFEDNLLFDESEEIKNIPLNQFPKYMLSLAQLNNMLKKAYVRQHIIGSIECGESADVTVMRILFKNIRMLEAAPNFLRLHFNLHNDEMDLSKSLTMKEHSTLILYKPGSKVAEGIYNILQEKNVYDSVFHNAYPGFSQAKDEIFNLIKNSNEGLECDAWTPFAGEFPGHCASKILINNNDFIKYIQFFSFNKNPLIPAFLEHFVKTYPEVYEWLLNPGVTTKESYTIKIRKM